MCVRATFLFCFSDSSEEIKALQKEIDELRKENEVAIQAKDQEVSTSSSYCH